MQMENNKKQYLVLLSEIIAKEAIIFGPDIAILKAQNVVGLVVDNSGNVTDIDGDVIQIFQELINKYKELSSQAIRVVMDPIFEKYPQIKKLINY